MKLKLLPLVALAMITLPSCMHPVDQVLHARADSKARLLEDQGQISQGACDDVGQYAANAGRSLTLEYATAEASARPLR